MSKHDIEFEDLSYSIDYPITQWHWKFIEGSLITESDLPNPVHSFQTYGSHSIELTITNSNEETTSRIKTITVKPSPLSDFEAPAVCQGVLTPFINTTNDNSTNVISWLWDFGDGSPISSDKEPGNHGYNPGTYNVSLTAMAFNECSLTINKKVKVAELPSKLVSIKGSSSFCSSDNTMIYVDNQPQYTYQWMANGADIADSVNYYIYPGFSDIYSARIYNTEAENCYVESNEISLTVKESPPAFEISELSNTTYCKNDPLSELSAPLFNNNTYFWLSNENVVSSDVDANTYIPNQSGEHVYSLRIRNLNNCTTTSSNTVEVLISDSPEIPTINLSGPTEFCQGNSVIISVENNTNFKYQWYNNNIAIEGETNNSIEAKETGNYLLRVIDKTSGCYSETEPVEIIVKENPAALTINSISEKTVCRGEAIELYVDATGVNFEWFKNGGNVEQNSNKYTSTAIESATYNMLVRNSSDCYSFSSNQINIIVIEPPQPPNIGLSGSSGFCEGLELTMQASNNPLYDYQWYNDNGAIIDATSNSYTTGKAGNYTLEVKTTNNCSASSLPVNVKVYNSPDVPTITITGSTEFCKGESTDLSVTAAGDITITWLKDGGELAEKSNKLTVTESGTYSVRHTNEGGCSTEATEPVEIKVHALPTVPAMNLSGPTSFCDGGSVSLSVPMNDNYSYQWQNTNDNIENATQNSFEAKTTGEYSLTITDENNCMATSESREVTVHNLPTPPVISANGATEFCQGEKVVLSTTENTGLTYAWTKNGIQTGITAPETEVATSGTFSLLVTDANGCKNMAIEPVEVKVHELPQGSALKLNGPTAFCRGGQVTLSVEENPEYTYQWKNEFGNIADANTASYSANENGAYSIVISNAFNCSVETEAQNVTVIDLPPNPMISVNGNNEFCAGESTELTLLETAGVGYQWLRNGIETGQTGINYTATESGEYSAIAVNESNCKSHTHESVNITKNPLPNIPSLKLSGATAFCQGENVLISVDEVAGNTYQWQNEFGNISNANSAIYAANQSGIFQLQITNEHDCSVLSKTQEVTVFELPVAPEIIVEGNTEFCEGESVVLSVVTADENTIKWLKNGIETGIKGNSYTATESGVYSIAASNANGCSVVSEQEITVTKHSLPDVPIISLSGASQFCEGETLAMSVEQQDGFTYQWQNAYGNINNATENSHITSVSGNFKVMITDENACSNISKPVNVEVKQRPAKPEITFDSELTFCEGNSIDLKIPPVADVEYQWKQNANILESNTNNLNVTESGDYTLSLKNGYGCFSEASNPVKVSVNPNPETPAISLQGDTEFCRGESVLLYTSLDENINYQWLNLGEITENMTNKIEVSESGVYKLHLSNSFGCEAESEPVSVMVKDVPETPEISVDGSLSFCEGETRNLSSEAQGGINYQWFLNNEETDNFTTDFLATQKGKYTLKATNEALCTSEASISLQVFDKPERPTISLDGATEFCAGNKLTLTAEEHEGNSYQWKNNNQDIANAISGILKVENTGNYSLTVENVYGCANQSFPVEVTVYDVPDKPIIEALSETEFCEGTNVELNTANNENLNYAWLLNGEPVSNGNSHNYIASKSGEYSIRIKNTKGCEAELSEPVKVTVFEAPDKQVVNMSGPKDFCEGGEVEMSVAKEDAHTYEWSKNNTLAATTPNITVYEEAIYQLKITNANGCSVTLDEIDVTVRPVPDEPQINVLSTSTNICPDDFVDMQVSNQQDGINYQWLQNGVEIANETNIDIKTNQAGLYKIEAADMGCTNVSEGTEINIKKAPDKPLLFAIGKEINILICTNITAKEYKWYFNGQEIPEAQYYGFIADNTPGEYYVSINEGGECSRNSNIVTLPLTDDKKSQYKALAEEYGHLVEGLNENTDANASIFIYPNPNNGMFNVDLSGVNETKFDIKVVDLSGRTVLRKTVHKDAHEAVFEFDLQNKGKGIYYFIIESTDHKFVEKVMVY